MTLSTQLVLPVTVPSVKDSPAVKDTPASSTSQPADNTFATHLQARQQDIQTSARAKRDTEPGKTTIQTPAGDMLPADTEHDLAALLDTEEPLAPETDETDQNLPNLALSILSEVRALRQGSAPSDAAPTDTLSGTSKADPRQLSHDLVATLKKMADAPLVQANTASPGSTDISLPNKAAPVDVPILPGITDPASRPARPAIGIGQWAGLQAQNNGQRFALRPDALAETAPAVTQEPRLTVETPTATLDTASSVRLPVMPASQPAMAPLPAAVAPVLQTSIATPVHSPDWSAALGRQFISLAQQAQGQIQSADIRLDPPELGPLRITLQIQDGVAHAMITSPHAQVRHAIEQSLQQLQQQFADNGLSLGQADVGDQHASHQHFQEQLAAQRQNNGQPGFSLETGAQTAMTPEAAQSRVLNPDALVDTFA